MNFDFRLATKHSWKLGTLTNVAKMKFRRTALTPIDPNEKTKIHCVVYDSQLEVETRNDERKSKEVLRW
jgi:hypothetical protein